MERKEELYDMSFHQNKRKNYEQLTRGDEVVADLGALTHTGRQVRREGLGPAEKLLDACVSGGEKNKVQRRM